jgi:SAM-dependent methyltransferase
MDRLWNQLEVGYYDKAISLGVKKGRGIQANWHNLTFLKVKKILGTSHSHLDFACGSGTFIGKYLNQNSIGVDISKSQIDYAQKKYNKNCRFLTLDEFNFEDYENSFDVITVLGLFEFIEDGEISRLLNKFYFLLKDGGKIIITTPNFNKLLSLALKLSRSLGNVDYSKEHNKRTGIHSLNKLFLTSGFKNVSVSKIINLGIVFSFISIKLGTIIEKIIETLFRNKVGFLYLIEIRK